MTSYTHSHWIPSAGGPFLLVSEADRLLWNGYIDDYWWACPQVEAKHVGVVRKRKKGKPRKYILCAFDGVDRKVSSGTQGILLWYWYYAKHENWDMSAVMRDFCRAVERGQAPLLETTRVGMRTGKYYFFDAAQPGKAKITPEWACSIQCERTVPLAKTYQWKIDAEHCLIVNALWYENEYPRMKSHV